MRLVASCMNVGVKFPPSDLVNFKMLDTNTARLELKSDKNVEYSFYKADATVEVTHVAGTTNIVLELPKFMYMLARK